MPVSEICIVGIGPGPVELLTLEARHRLETASKVFFRMKGHPVYSWLAKRGTQLVDFSPLYAVKGLGQPQRYQFMADAIIKEAQLRGSVVYALPGNPHVFETTSVLVRRAAAELEIPVRVIPGMSFLELIYVELGLDPGGGLQIYNSWQIDRKCGLAYNPRVPILIGQVDPGTGVVQGQLSLKWVQEQLLGCYPPDHHVHLVWVEAQPVYQTSSMTVALKDLSHRRPGRGEFASLLVPALM